MGVSRRRFAQLVGVTEKAVRKALASGRITTSADGTIDPETEVAAWSAATDPARSKVRHADQSAPLRTGGAEAETSEIATAEDAERAIGLVRDVLRKEGYVDPYKLSFADARTAETVLKAQRRALDIEKERGNLIDRAAAERRVFELAREERDAWLAWPWRIAVLMAAELNVDARALGEVLKKHVREHLDELGAPVVVLGN